MQAKLDMSDINKIFIPTKEPNKFRFAVKVKAGAKLSAIEGLMLIEDVWHLKLSIKAPPEHGKANAAIIEFLAQEWNVSKDALQIIRGVSSNRKVMIVTK